MNILDVLVNFMNSYLYWIVPTSVNTTDIVEILILAFLFYEIMAWVRRTRAWVLFKGLIFILAFLLIAAIFQMTTILFIATRLVNVGLIALIILFQPELRNALEHLGRKNVLAGMFSIDKFTDSTQEMLEKVAKDIATACSSMSESKTGALIVLEKDVPLDTYVKSGITLDAELSPALLRNIFEKNTPLHDGAVIVRDNRIVAATCYLPLSDNKSIDKDYGTRHRAAIGMSEVSDSLTVIVSEETGAISIARDGILSSGLSESELAEAIMRFAFSGMETEGLLETLKRRLKNVKETNE
jgi:diadenylate cyclase